MRSFLLLALAIFALSCEKDIEPTPLTQAEQEQVNSLLVGTWEDVSYNGKYCRFTEDFIYSDYFDNENVITYNTVPIKYAIAECSYSDDNRYMLYRLELLDGVRIDLFIEKESDPITLWFVEIKNKVAHPIRGFEKISTL